MNADLGRVRVDTPRPACRRREGRAFTIFELIVVFACVLVLISILVPALSRLMAAGLATRCATNIAHITISVRTYAAENDRWYPMRRVIDEAYRGPEWAQVANGPDDRPTLRRTVGPNPQVFWPPMIDADLSDLYEQPTNVHIRLPYALWFGFAYRGEVGIQKVDHRLHLTDALGISHRFRVLVGDYDGYDTATGAIQSSHVGMRRPQSALDGTNEGGADESVVEYRAFVDWGSFASPQHPGDLHYAFDDGGVETIENVLVRDPRMVLVPAMADPALAPTRFIQLPR